jgi:hypothetical protein
MIELQVDLFFSLIDVKSIPHQSVFATSIFCHVVFWESAGMFVSAANRSLSHIYIYIYIYMRKSHSKTGSTLIF